MRCCLYDDGVLTALCVKFGQARQANNLLADKTQAIAESIQSGNPPDYVKSAGKDASPKIRSSAATQLQRPALMGVGPLLVHEAVLGVVAEDLRSFSRAFQRSFKPADRRRRAPVVVGNIRLQRHADVRWIGVIAGRDAVAAIGRDCPTWKPRANSVSLASSEDVPI
jgi:hypothetical protein